jgi:NADH oxidoreductase Hcr
MNLPTLPDCPTPECPHRMQVHSIHQETPDVWTLSLIGHDHYTYQAGQFAMVNIANDGETLRAYSLSSTPGLSRFLTLTVRHIADGVGSGWLTQQVKVGDYLWLSDAMGEFTCTAQQPLLLLAGGCGVTPVMSLCRALLASNTSQPLDVIYSVHSPEQVIFAQEWQQLQHDYPQLTLKLMASTGAVDGFCAGRLNLQTLQDVTSITQRKIMLCGPAGYMKQVSEWLQQLGVSAQQVVSEQFYEPNVADSEKTLTLRTTTPLGSYPIAAGVSLLSAMEQYHLPVKAACRAGVCGCCKTRILSGDYQRTNTQALSAEEIAQGYVLACSCVVNGDIELA